MRLIVAVLAILVLGLTLACSDDDGNEPSATPTAPAASSPTSPPGSPTVQAGTCPVAADVCTFARTVSQAVTAGNFDAILNTAQSEQFTCPAGRPQGLGGPYPLCDGAAGGTTRAGYRVAVLASEGTVVDLAGLRAELTRWPAAATPALSDAYGTGANRLYTVGCPAGVVPCGNQIALVFSQLRAVPTRIQMVLFFERQGATSTFTMEPLVVFGPLLQPGEEQAALRGGAFTGNFIRPDGWPPITTLYAVPQ